jgi:hypothetical protein
MALDRFITMLGRPIVVPEGRLTRFGSCFGMFALTSRWYGGVETEDSRVEDDLFDRITISLDWGGAETRPIGGSSTGERLYYGTPKHSGVETGG